MSNILKFNAYADCKDTYNIYLAAPGGKTIVWFSHDGEYKRRLKPHHREKFLVTIQRLKK